MSVNLKFDRPDDENRLDNMDQGILGQDCDRPEGPMKVAGRAPYAAEWQMDGLAHGVLVRAPVSAGRVKSWNIGEVLDMEGVLSVITDKRLLRNPAQGMAGKAPVQGPDRISYLGQPIALVVAESFEAARDGAARLAPECETGAALIEADDWETLKVEEAGDLEAAMRSAAHVVDATYTTPGHSSVPMEPHASIAEWQDDRLTLRGSYQMLKFNRNELADALGIAPEKVRILSPYVGGGFGSKLGIAPEAVAAAIAARELGRPVSVVLSRQQVFEATMRRSETRQRVRLAADSEGRLTGIGHEAWVSNLKGESFAESATRATAFTYRGENRFIASYLSRLSRTCAGSVRAPGEAVGHTIFEVAMDELAIAAGIDPVELRLRNIPESDPSTRLPFSSHKMAETLRKGAQDFGWDSYDPVPGIRRDGEWLIGHGMSSAIRVNRLMESDARVRMEADGMVTVETDMTDIGTGTYAVLSQIAAEMLGRPLEKVTCLLGDTDLPPSSGAGGSFGASSSGTSVYLACLDLRRQIAGRIGCAEDDMTLADDHAISGNSKASLPDILGGEAMEGYGHCEPGETAEKVRQAAYGAYFAEVAVSAVTGETRVRRMLGCFAAGRILNRKTARSQCLGGMTWGIGMALTEELLHDPRYGHIVNNDLAEYHLPVNLDIPDLDVLLLENDRDPWASPVQAKGIGELGICGAAAAVTNAIYNATGVRVRNFPATLDKVLAGLPEPEAA